MRVPDRLTRGVPGRGRGPLVVLAAAGLAALAAFAAFKLTTGGAQTVPLAALAREQQEYVGQQISTTGTVRRLTDPDGSSYYVLSDPRQDVVLLRPAAAVRQYLGRHVHVVGGFRFDPQAGRVLRVRQIHAG